MISIRLARLSIIVSLCAVAVPVLAAPWAVLTPTVIFVPEEYHTGGAYTAIQAGRDGRVYLGTTIYDGYAHLLSFVPSSGRVESLIEMSAATGERTPGPYAQAKIHTKPAIAPDGRVYFGTKSGKPAADARWQQNYPGGHLLVYDPRSGRTTDLGIVKPRVSIIAVGIDPSRGLVYALTDPESRLVTYDPQTRTFADRGQLGPQGEPPSRYLVVLSNGDVYHPYGDGAMAQYVAASGAIRRLPLTVTGSGTYEEPYALVTAQDGRRFIGLGNQTGQVYVFEAREQQIGVRILGTVKGQVEAPLNLHYTMALAPDGSAYYTGSVRDAKELFVFRVPPDLSRPEVVGRVSPIPPAPAGYSRTAVPGIIVQGSTFTPDGTLIVMTAYPLRLIVFRGIASR
ncbi:MAG: hypothetical protein ACT4PY_06585 [Armatimonadota bacterium]